MANKNITHCSFKMSGIIPHPTGLAPLLSCPVYTATKHGVVGFTRALSVRTWCHFLSKQHLLAISYLWSFTLCLCVLSPSLLPKRQALAYVLMLFAPDLCKLTFCKTFQNDWGSFPAWLMKPRSWSIGLKC